MNDRVSAVRVGSPRVAVSEISISKYLPLGKKSNCLLFRLPARPTNQKFPRQAGDFRTIEGKSLRLKRELLNRPVAPWRERLHQCCLRSGSISALLAVYGSDLLHYVVPRCC